MGRVINLPHDRHREVQELLPWYALGRLDAADRAAVEAHLDECEDCRGELAFDRRLGAAIETPALDVEAGWAAMQRRLAPAAAKTPVAARFGAWVKSRLSLRSPSFGWALAAQASLLLVTAGLLVQFAPADNNRFHALGAAPASKAGNIVVIFRPETNERAIRTLLRATAARVVDGPTTTDAYVLHVAPADRAAALARLRKNADVVLAEPIDATASR